MKVMIMGMDGYLGWTLAMYMSSRGHQVCGVDNFSRRRNVAEIGGDSATPIKPMALRLKAYEKAKGTSLSFFEGDLTEPSFTDLVIAKEKPDCIVHLGEIPSAPYSMIDVQPLQLHADEQHSGHQQHPVRHEEARPRLPPA